MRATTKLIPLILFGGTIAFQACESVTVDPSQGGVPPAGVIRGSVSYNGPPPCSQGGHIVGNAVVLVFDARNPPPPNGLGNTAVNFGVVSGDDLFHNYPVTQGTKKICPAADAPPVSVSGQYIISPMAAGQYFISAFFDYTGDFFATFKFRNLPEATDVGGGYIDLNDATKLVQAPNTAGAVILKDGGIDYPLAERQSDPNYVPISLPVNVGVETGPAPTSLRGVPNFTMPAEGYLADNINVTIGSTLGLARPYFYPEGSALPATTPPAGGSVNGIQYGGSAATRPATGTKTAQNPTGNPDFVPVLSFPQDIQVYAQPDPSAAGQAPTAFDEYQEAFPGLILHAGVPLIEQPFAADTASATDPFHMQLGLANAPANYAPGGNGGLYVWWDGTHIDEDCNGIPNCNPLLLGQIPENALLKRMWPIVVLAKIADLPTGASQPNPIDPEEVNPQGADLTKPIVIIQGITLGGDSLLSFAQGGICTGADCTSGSSNNTMTGILAYPDTVNHTNLQDHVTVMVRPSTVCMDPRAPDHGGVVVTPGQVVTQNGDQVILGKFPPSDSVDNPDPTMPTQGVVVDSEILSNPQLAGIVNRRAQGSANGLIGACLPTGRYEINLVYPTGQAWTTPNESGSCAQDEGSSIFNGTGMGFDPGNCSVKPRPVLYSQGTRAIVEITPTTNPNNCKAGTVSTATSIGAVPFACTSLCPDPSQDPTANPPCSKPLPPQ